MDDTAKIQEMKDMLEKCCPKDLENPAQQFKREWLETMLTLLDPKDDEPTTEQPENK